MICFYSYILIYILVLIGDVTSVLCTGKPELRFGRDVGCLSIAYNQNLLKTPSCLSAERDSTSQTCSTEGSCTVSKHPVIILMDIESFSC